MHWFIDPIKEHYVDFNGRATREQYWMFILLYVVIYIALIFILKMIGMKMLMGLFYLAIILPSIALAARRLHDINKSGWWQLIGLIPVVGWIVLIVWLASEGDKEGNRFGMPASVVSDADSHAAADSAQPAEEAKPATEVAAPAAEEKPSPKDESGEAESGEQGQ